ncbi:MAG: hypothetical protein M3040_06120 [Bacteroidota bacterium]|nr:hypothetical protein [Bacteroidota bacterium]
MSNKTELEKDKTSTPGTNVTDKNKQKNPTTVRNPRKTKKRLKNSSVAQINAAEGSAVGAVKANSSRTVRGSSGLANTGTIISYD